MATSNECGSTSKRRRTAPANAPADINDLTADTLVAVAEFLPKTSRVLFAVALTAPSSSWREREGRGTQPISNASKAIVASSVAPEEDPSGDFISSLWLEASSNGYNREKREIKDERGHTGVPTFKDGIWEQIKEYYGDDRWSVLDFADIGNLASRLTDDDIKAVLLCIDAPNRLRRLNVTNCFGLVGHGLGPLRHSAVLEKIDMGLYRQLEKPKKFDNAQLSKEAVYPIIEEILRTEGNSLARLQRPMHWWNEDDSTMIEREVRFHEDHGFSISYPSNCCYFGIDGDTDGVLALLKSRTGPDMVDTCPDCGNKDFGVCGDCRFIRCDRCFLFYGCLRCGMKQCGCCSQISDKQFSIATTENARINTAPSVWLSTGTTVQLIVQVARTDSSVTIAKTAAQKCEIERLREDLSQLRPPN